MDIQTSSKGMSVILINFFSKLLKTGYLKVSLLFVMILHSPSAWNKNKAGYPEPDSTNRVPLAESALPTYGRTDGLTDTFSYRYATSHLKTFSVVLLKSFEKKKLPSLRFLKPQPDFSKS